MTMYNESMQKVLARMPSRMLHLPITNEGWPTLWFAGITKEGKPDLRSADPNKWVQAVRHHLCWICGQKLGVNKCFILGPMCSINRITSEPPTHRECAEFAVVACPFLSKPKMRRNSANMPEEAIPMPGFPIARNPGTICIWITRNFKVFSAQNGNSGNLIELGEPQEVTWYAEGRQATRAEVLHSIETGYPALFEIAKTQNGGIAALEKMRDNAMHWLPQ